MPKQEYKNTKFQSPQSQESIDSDKDTVDAESENWNPTPEVFQAFLVRDYELATQNLHFLMRGRPLSVRDLKDQSLHSMDVIERVLTSGIASGRLTEAQGKYSLVGT
jgi:hypothetical protein